MSDDAVAEAIRRNQVALEVLECCAAHEHNVRLIGNVTALELSDLAHDYRNMLHGESELMQMFLGAMKKLKAERDAALAEV